MIKVNQDMDAIGGQVRHFGREAYAMSYMGHCSSYMIGSLGGSSGQIEVINQEVTASYKAWLGGAKEHKDLYNTDMVVDFTFSKESMG